MFYGLQMNSVLITLQVTLKALLKLCTVLHGLAIIVGRLSQDS